MATLQGVEFRYTKCRVCKSSPETSKGKPEVMVAMHDDKKVWARDNGPRGIQYFTEGNTTPTPQYRITLWLPAFQRQTLKERRCIIRSALAEHTASHTEELESNTSSGVRESSNDTPSVYTPGTPDEDILDAYLKHDLVPDETAATLIGDARGRQQHDGISVPARVIIESKARSLITASPPWLTFPYSVFCMTIKSCGENPKKRKREDVSSSAPRKPGWQGLWEHLVATGLSLEIQEGRKRRDEHARLVKERVMRVFE